MKRVAIYVRVSSEEQTRGHSLDSQRDALRAWADREGWEVTTLYEDAGISATGATKRPAFMRMIADAEAGAFDCVLVKKRDRYARDLADAATYERLLAAHGVRVWSHDEPATNDDSPAGFLMKGMLDVFAAHYSVELSKKTSEGWRKRTEKGLPVGDIPFGYRSTGPQSPPEIVPDEAEALREAFSTYAAGVSSLVDIAENLNRRGVRPRSKRGSGTFGEKMVRGMFGNKFYAGEITYKGETVARGMHEAIIDKDLFDRVQLALEARARRPRAHGTRHTRVYQLSGIGHCSRCSSPLWANTVRGQQRYYRCSSRRRGHLCADAGVGAIADVVEEDLAGLFADMDLPDAWQERIFEVAAEGGDADAIWRERRRLEDRLMRLRRLLVEGYVDEEYAKTEIDTAESALAALTPPDAAAIPNGEELVRLPDLWPKMTAEERREVVRASLDLVSVDLRARRVTAFTPRKHLEVLFKLMPHVDVVTGDPERIRTADLHRDRVAC